MRARTGSAAFATARLIAEAAPRHAAGLCAWLLWKASQPALYTLTIGGMLDLVTPGRGAGSDVSSTFHKMTFYLTVLGGLFVGNLCFSAIGDSLTTAVSWRVSRCSGQRLLRAISTPGGIAHMELPAVADQIALARGQIVSAAPRRLIALLLSITGARLSGLAMALLLYQFHWWAPLLVGAAAITTRSWMLRDIRAYQRGLQLSAPKLRRAGYFRDIAVTASAAKELRLFWMLDWVLERFTGVYREGLREVWGERKGSRSILAAAITAQVVMFGFVGTEIALSGLQGRFGAGQMAIYLQAAWGMLSLIEGPTMEYEFRRAALAVSTLFGLERDCCLAITTGRRKAARSQTLEAPREIRFERVGFRYQGDSRDILCDFNMTLRAGDAAAIVGKNGSGKSTLIKLLTGLYAPNSGRILVDGIDLRDIDLRAWRAQVSVILQDFSHWPLSLRENVGFGSHRALVDDKLIWQALKVTGSEELARSLPRRLDTVLSTRFTGGIDLSGGQWQRIGLARAMAALYGGAKVLILDEPTAHLDVRGEAAFNDRFLRESGSTMSVVISHRFSTIRRAGRIMVLEGGRMIEDGSHDELMCARGFYASQFNLQADSFRMQSWEASAEEDAV